LVATEGSTAMATMSAVASPMALQVGASRTRWPPVLVVMRTRKLSPVRVTTARASTRFFTRESPSRRATSAWTVARSGHSAGAVHSSVTPAGRSIIEDSG
jgi:hypothetical protein